jgi:hypothetical protein
MQRIWTAGKVNVACGPKCGCLLIKEKHKKPQYFKEVVKFSMYNMYI